MGILAIFACPLQFILLMIYYPLLYLFTFVLVIFPLLGRGSMTKAIYRRKSLLGFRGESTAMWRGSRRNFYSIFSTIFNIRVKQQVYSLKNLNKRIEETN